MVVCFAQIAATIVIRLFSLVARLRGDSFWIAWLDGVRSMFFRNLSITAKFVVITFRLDFKDDWLYARAYNRFFKAEGTQEARSNKKQQEATRSNKK